MKAWRPEYGAVYNSTDEPGLNPWLCVPLGGLVSLKDASFVWSMPEDLLREKVLSGKLVRVKKGTSVSIIAK